METSIVFFDLASGISVPLSPYTTMVRLALNLKKLNYTTQWLHFPDVEPTLKSNGFQPTGQKADGSPRYTVPAIIDRTNIGPDQPQPVILADSTPIIEYLEKTYPTPGIATLLPEPARPLLHFFDQYIMSEDDDGKAPKHFQKSRPGEGRSLEKARKDTQHHGAGVR